jgi:hypothetical protein
LALSIAREQVKNLDWLVEQTENRLRQNRDLLEKAKAMVECLQKVEEPVEVKVRYGPQEWTKPVTWKLYQAGLLDAAHLSDLNQESDRQQAEKNRWIDAIHSELSP